MDKMTLLEASIHLRNKRTEKEVESRNGADSLLIIKLLGEIRFLEGYIIGKAEGLGVESTEYLASIPIEQ